MTRAGLLSAEEERELALAIRAGRRAASAVVLPGDGEERNRAEVGRLLSVSRERVRQIELEAFERLRRAARVQGLGELVG